MEKDNLLVIHGGGPTAVMNASLWGVLGEAAAHGEIDRVYGAVGGWTSSWPTSRPCPPASASCCR